MKKIVSTTIGDISYYQTGKPQAHTLVFMHGVFFDHSMWDYFTEKLPNFNCINIDMPSHGDSKNPLSWNLDTTAGALIEVLEKLKISNSSLIGHSWGSMTAIRAAFKNPKIIKNLILFNSPMKSPNLMTKLVFKMQMSMAGMTNFYATQAAKSLLGNEYINENPKEIDQMKIRMNKMGAETIRHTIQKVIIESDNGYKYYNKIEMPKVFITAQHDYTRQDAPEDSIILTGGHVSPIDNKEKSLGIIVDNVTHLNKFNT